MTSLKLVLLVLGLSWWLVFLIGVLYDAFTERLKRKCPDLNLSFIPLTKRIRVVSLIDQAKHVDQDTLDKAKTAAIKLNDKYYNDYKTMVLKKVETILQELKEAR